MAILVSCGAVSLLGGAIGCWGWIAEPHWLTDRDYISVTGCALLPDGERAMSLYWVQSASGPAWPPRLGIHRLAEDEAPRDSPWPEICPQRIAPAPSGRRLFTADTNGAVYAADLQCVTRSPMFIGRQLEPEVLDLKCSVDGRWLTSLSTDGLYAWDVQRAELLWRRPVVGVLTCCDIFPKSQSLVCGLADGRLVEIDLESNEMVRCFARDGGHFLEVACSQDGRRIVGIRAGGVVQLFRWSDGKLLWERDEFPGFAPAARIALFSPCGALLVIPSRHDIRRLTIRSAATGDLIRELTGHTRPVAGARFAADGRLLTWGSDGTVRTWEVYTGQELSVMRLGISAK